MGIQQRSCVSLPSYKHRGCVTSCARGPHLVVVLQAYGLLQHLELIFPLKFTHTYMALEIGSMSKNPVGGCGTDSWQSPTPNPHKL
jgi:hypothetical protein